MTEEVEALADTAVAHAVASHPHQRAVCAAILRNALTLYAKLTDDASAADLAFQGYARHNQRAAKAPRFSGSRK